MPKNLELKQNYFTSEISYTLLDRSPRTRFTKETDNGVETVAESPRSRIRGVIKIKKKGGNTENKMAELKM